MKRGLISVAAAVGVMAAMVIAPVQSASAYPPGTALTVSASPNVVGVGQTVTATASNVKPGCRVEFKFGSREVKVSASGSTATARITAPTRVGSYSLTAKCSSNGERATTTVRVIGRGEVHGPANVCLSKSFTISVTGFAPRTRVTVVLRKATSEGGSNGRSVTYSESTRTNSSGSASVRFRVNRTGVYVVSAVSEGQRAYTALSVARCR